MKFHNQSARFKTSHRQLARRALVLCLFLGVTLVAGEPPAEADWRVGIAGNLCPRNTFTTPIPGAKETKFTAAYSTAGGGSAESLRYLDTEAFAALGVDWATFVAKTAAAASAELANLKPEILRDRNDVIECAILRAKCPADNITVAVLAPDFLKRFTPFFGRKILVVVPDRHTVYLFPTLASRYQAYGEKILSVYNKSTCPVSREVFELSSTGLRAIGAYGGP